MEGGGSQERKGVSLHIAPDYSINFEVKKLLLSYKTYAMTCVCTNWYNHSYEKNKGKNYECLLGSILVLKGIKAWVNCSEHMNDCQYLSLGDIEQNEPFPKSKSWGFLVP